MKTALITFLFIFLLFLNCATTRTTHIPQFNNSEDYHKYTDSVFAKYQIESFHKLRDLPYLKPALDTLANTITNTINQPQVKAKINFKSISFLVLPSGRLKLAYFSNFNKSFLATTGKNPEQFISSMTEDLIIDTLIANIANDFKTDSIPNYNAKLWITGAITVGPIGYKYSFKDTSYYSLGLTGGRSRMSIMSVVMKEVPKLKEAYNQTLRLKRNISGIITVKFAIDEFGSVIFADIVQDKTTITDTDLRVKFIMIIKDWKFARINKEGDVTEVIYPFTLSQ